ncbi:hypothetical protein [Streptomyces enissocaesilis]|uniref:Uncharacterized protein n=1 Tax=Streptomyces enissocaesilis TaxID=332589 RepID=A0ABN3XK31_9ACTN
MRISTALAASAFAASVLLGSAGTALACDGENGPEGRHHSEEYNDGRHHSDEYGDKGRHHSKGKEAGYAEYCNIGGENGVTHARFMGYKEHSKGKYDGHHEGYQHHGSYKSYCVSSHS